MGVYRLCFPNRLSVFGAAFELVDRRINGWITKRLLHGPLRHSNSPTVEPTKNGRPTDPITPWCGRTLFFLSFLIVKRLNWVCPKKYTLFYSAVYQTSIPRSLCPSMESANDKKFNRRRYSCSTPACLSRFRGKTFE